MTVDILALPQRQPALTVAEIVSLYLDKEGRFLAERTLIERTRILQRFAADMGNLLVKDCRRSDLRGWLADMSSLWKSAATLHTAVTAVQRAFNWAVDEEHIARNPFKGVRHQDGEPRRAVTDDELQLLLRHADARFRRVLIFLRFTGCRPCEMGSLRWDEINTALGAIVQRQHKTHRQTKTPRPRIIRMVDVVVRLLAYELAQQLTLGVPSDFVFLNARGNPWTRCSLSDRVQAIRARAGLPDDCKLYGIRHRFATAAAINGTPMKILAELLGHTSSRTAEKYYVHLESEEEAMRQAMEKAAKRRA